MPALIARVREFLNKNPRAKNALAIGLAALAGLLLYSRLFGGGPAPAVRQTPPSQPQALPAPGPTAATPAPARAPEAPKTPGVPPGPTGRPDPFAPLVAERPQGAPLPPPPFPGPGALPPPPLPGDQPFGLGGAIRVTGIVGDTKAVAVVAIGGRTEIVMVGETIGTMRVLRIDSTRRLVTFLEGGRRFDVPMGGE